MHICANKKLVTLILAVLLCSTVSFVIPQQTTAQHDNYPKLANYYLDWDINTEQKIVELAKWDFVILVPQALDRNPQVIKKLRQYNPDIKIVAYVLTQEINRNALSLPKGDIWRTIHETVNKNDWWLKDGNGNKFNKWPNTWFINASSTGKRVNGERWVDYLPKLVQQKILYRNSPWDGVYYDNLWSHISWTNPSIDINNNGRADTAAYVDAKWKEGEDIILEKTRQLAPGKIIMGNTTNNNFNKKLNGRLLENFPTSYEGNWQGNMDHYINHGLGYSPQFFIINRTTGNTQNNEDYQAFRFGLTSTLMGDGYYSFDSGDYTHTERWWYDEYNIFLGDPLTNLQNVFDPSSQIKPGVWKRSFENGEVYVNSTSTPQRITLSHELEKIKGTQDTKVNNGALVKSITIQPYDGIVLLKRIEQLIGDPFANGSFVRAFDKYGTTVRNGFFAYDRNYKGNRMLLVKDINKDGKLETLMANNQKIIIYSDTNQILSAFYPYGQSYGNGINFTVSDFENDGYYEIVTGTGQGSAATVKVFNHKGQPLTSGFNAYTTNFRGGVNVAVCDLNGNGKKQIVTGAGYMGGPHVRIFEKDGTLLSGGFFAYNKTFRGGVNIACGNIDGNPQDEIITGAGIGGTSHVRYFDGKTRPLSPGFFAYGKESRNGVRVFVNDLNKDGKHEILAESPNVFSTSFK